MTEMQMVREQQGDRKEEEKTRKRVGESWIPPTSSSRRDGGKREENDGPDADTDPFNDIKLINESAYC